MLPSDINRLIRTLEYFGYQRISYDTHKKQFIFAMVGGNSKIMGENEVRYLAEQIGISYINVGIAKELRPGDLVDASSLDTRGIYIFNSELNKMVETRNTKNSKLISIVSYYYNRK